MIGRAFGSAFYTYAKQRYEGLRRSYSDPAKLQEKNLKRILKYSGDTAFGRYFGFKDIRSVADYQRSVPLVRYEGMKPWIDACLNGKPNHIWPGKLRYFALTSGTTTGRSKYIPVSREAIADNRRAGRDCVSFYLINTQDTSLFDGKLFFLGGSTALERMPHGLLSGDMSGIMSGSVPFYIRGRAEPASELALIPDWEEKIKRVAESTRDKDVRLISGLPSWLTVFFEYVLEGKSDGKLCDVWKNLSLLIYGGMDFSPYSAGMLEATGKNIYSMETYFASEAFIGIQDTPGRLSDSTTDGVLLMLDYGVFYEFIEADDAGNEGARRYTASEVETGVNYAVAITNRSGLYGYIIGDTVKFVSTDPLRIKITGRLDNFISALGEHLITEEAEYAIAEASLRTEALVNDFTVAPVFPGRRARPRHQWLVEFAKRPDEMENFLKIIDETLSLRNDDYHIHRKRGFGMQPPSVYELKEGTFYKWHSVKGTLGGQHKTPHLKNDRKMAEELIKLNLE